MARLAEPVPRAIKIVASRSGGHVKVRIWIGQEPHPGLCGELTMRPEDWSDFYRMCLFGDPSFWPGYPSTIRYDSEETEAWLETQL
jgi:hypothetical protein